MMPKIKLFVLLLSLISSHACVKKKDTSTDDLVKLILLGAILNPPCKYGTFQGGNDPLYSFQWHLNQGNSNDAGVEVPWSQGITGQGITVSIVDDGLETKHEDLCGNISSVKSINFLKNSNDPDHYYLESGHGTSVAGVIAATMNNTIGLRGAAPSAKLTARNILELSAVSSSIVAEAMSMDTSGIHISNNSWGAPDGTGLYSDVFASSAWKSAIETGISVGRGGLGTIYTWAAGNGGSSEVDNSNLDGQANFHGVLAICGVGKNGVRAYYSEQGANLWVCAHTMGNDGIGISTTDRMGDRGGNNLTKSSNYSDRSYRNDFNGTSSAAPLAAGVIALLLSKYPNLNWRDVREILAESAIQNDPGDTDWTTNGSGLFINHKYGFGTIHAQRALERASSWTLISSSKPYISEEQNLTSLSLTLNSTSINYIEYIDVYFTTNSPDLGKLKVELEHTYNSKTTKSILLNPHNCYTSSGNNASCENFSSSANIIRLGVSRHLGETALGNWNLNITNGSGTHSAKLIFRGRTSK